MRATTAGALERGLARAELAAFLRSRRERLRPEQVGLPPTGRRRTPGLRREELAALAGMSATWYAFLEQGRDVRASEQVLGSLSRALGLSEAERGYLFALGGDPPDTTVHRPPAGGLSAVVAALDPHPAYVTDAVLDLVAVNDAALEMFTGRDGAADPPANLAGWMFADPVAQQVIVDWEQVARGLLARLRCAAGHHRGDPRFADLVAELRATSDQADAWWQHHDVAAPRAGTKRLRHPLVGTLRMAHTALAVADQPGQTLVVYTPAA